MHFWKYNNQLKLNGLIISSLSKLYSLFKDMSVFIENGVLIEISLYFIVNLLLLSLYLFVKVNLLFFWLKLIL